MHPSTCSSVPMAERPAYRKSEKMRKRVNEGAPMGFSRTVLTIVDRPLIVIGLHHPLYMCSTHFAGKLTDQYLTPTRSWAKRYRRGERVRPPKFQERRRDFASSCEQSECRRSRWWFRWPLARFLRNASVTLERERVRACRMSPRDRRRLASNVPKDTTRAGRHGKWFRAW